jgi:hypothetical protein
LIVGGRGVKKESLIRQRQMGSEERMTEVVDTGYPPPLGSLIDTVIHTFSPARPSTPDTFPYSK